MTKRFSFSQLFRQGKSCDKQSKNLLPKDEALLDNCGCTNQNGPSVEKQTNDSAIPALITLSNSSFSEVETTISGDDASEEVARRTQFSYGEEDSSECSTLSSLTTNQVTWDAECETSSAKTIKDKHVTFEIVEVRRYDLILGDNPYCNFPLSIDWEYQQHPVEVENINKYEEHRRALRKVSPVMKEEKRRTRELRSTSETEREVLNPLDSHERRMRLRQFGYTESNLRQAERKRVVALALDWKNGGFPKFPFSKEFVKRYTR